MGLLGSGIGSILGSAAGEMLGGIAGKKGAKVGGQIGGLLGGSAGKLLPFKKGGKVTKKTQPALLHKGEVVVPAKYAKDIPASLKKKMKKDGARNM